MALTSDIDLEYKQMIEKAARKEDDLEVPNSTLGHALLVYSFLIGTTEKDLRILTGYAEEIDYKEIREGLENLAKKFREPYKQFNFNPLWFKAFGIKQKPPIQRRIKILLSEEESYGSDFYNFARDYKDVIKMKRFRNPNHMTPHFLISDERAYREEEKHSKEALKDYNIRAIANFNDSSKSFILGKFFDHCWNLEDRLLPIQ